MRCIGSNCVVCIEHHTLSSAWLYCSVLGSILSGKHSSRLKLQIICLVHLPGTHNYGFHLFYSKSLECAKLLVGAGVDVNCRNAKDNTPLMVAAALGHYNILEFLIAQPNIEINAQVQTFKHLQCMYHEPFYS